LQHPIIGNTENGFTLIEVMVSLAAMAIGLVLLWGLHFSSLRMEWTDHRRTQAVEIGRRNLEILRTQNMMNPAPGSATPLVLNPCPDTTGFALPSFPASSTCTASVQWSEPSFPWQRTVTLTITWPERSRIGPGGSSATAIPQTVQMVAVYSDHLNP
jgi:prepilin-type N-terminal cleavage/methylation domain-containing protein